MAEPYFPRQEYEHRWHLVQQQMRARNLPAAVVWGRSGGTYDRAGDVLYLTNYYGNNSGQGYDNPHTQCRAFSAVLLQEGEEPELVIDDSWPHRNLIATERIRFSRNPAQGVAQALNARNITGTVGLCGTDFFPMKYWRQLQEETQQVSWVDADGLVLQVRRVKSSRELTAVREAGRIASQAMTRMIEALLSGDSEAEAAAEAAREVVCNGGAVHMMPCSHGELIEYFVSKPLPGYSRSIPAAGDLVRAFVYGPMFEGYYSDPGRTVVVGRRMSKPQRELIESCADLCETLLGAIRPGVSVQEIAHLGDREAAQFDKDQAADKFPLYGHGLGLFFEKPYISTVMGDPEDVFLEGMVIGVECFLGRKGVGSAGFEQNAIISSTGVEVVTTTPMRW
jgi:Xaa-Pro aminopeptidase